MSKPRITVRFDDEVYESIKKLAKEQERSINWIVNKMLSERLLISSAKETKKEELNY